MFRLVGVVIGLLVLSASWVVRADEIALLPTAISGQMPNKPGWKVEFDGRLATRAEGLKLTQSKQIAAADLECLEAQCFGGTAARAHSQRAVRGLVYYLGSVGYQVRFLVDDGGKGRLLEAKCPGCNELKVAELLVKLFDDAMSSAAPAPVVASAEPPPKEPALAPPPMKKSAPPQRTRYDKSLLGLTLGTGIPLLAAGAGGIVGLAVKRDYFFDGGSTSGKVMFGTFTVIAGASIIAGLVDVGLLVRFGKVDDGANR